MSTCVQKGIVCVAHNVLSQSIEAVGIVRQRPIRLLPGGESEKMLAKVFLG